LEKSSETPLGAHHLIADQALRCHPPVDPSFLFERVEEYYELNLRQECGGRHPLKGLSPGANAVRVRSNDYLCLAGDKRLVDAEVRTLMASGHGDSVSRVWGHHQKDSLRAFEERMARLTLADDGVVCSSGYTANVGLIQAMSGPNIPVYLDMKAHMSLWEGVSSAKAIARPFRHNDAQQLGRLIERHGPGLVVVDALYSTDGSVCNLIDFVDVCEQYACALIVDETHSFGTHGPAGAGMVVEQGLAHRVHFRTIGLSKAVASRGGIVLCSSRNAEFFRYRSLPSVFSTSVLPHEVAGYDAVLDIFEREPWRREQLHRNHAYLLPRIAALGYNVESSQSQIISLEPGEIEYLLLLRDALESRGVFGSVFYPPATPDRRCLIRFTLNCNLSRAELDRIASVLHEIRDEVRLSEWRSTQKLLRMPAKPKTTMDTPAPAAVPSPNQTGVVGWTSSPLSEGGLPSPVFLNEIHPLSLRDD
jgi:CAI-1 autoinducer synthase